MSKLLQKITTWATDALYPAGALPWSGLPTKVSVPLGQQASGVAPNEQLSAERFNYLMNGIQDSFAVVAHSALRQWSNVLISSTTDRPGKKLASFQPLGTTGAPGDRQRLIATAGIKTSNSDALLGLSSDGRNFANFALDLGYASFASFAVDDSDNVFGGLTGVATCKKYNLSSGSGTITPGNSTVAQAAHYSVSHYLIAAEAQLYTASSLAGPWTATSLGSGGDSIEQFANNGAAPPSGSPRVIMNKVAVFNGHNFVYYSTDDGLTFTVAKDFGAVALSLCYSSAYDLFFAMDVTTKQLWSSPDGAAWTLEKTIAGLEAGVSGANAMAACGYALAHIIAHTSTPSQPLYGIAFSFDRGATWFETYIGDVTNTNPLNAIISANGRFYVSDDWHVYVSGILQSPSALFTGA
jgi:hypothetical protein